jgi:DNA-binding transcriptional ArsR family regulator
MEETREYHSRYHNAINNPIRRLILKALRQHPKTLESLCSDTGLEIDILGWHLNILENGFCVKKGVLEGETIYEITKEGMVIDYLDEK